MPTIDELPVAVSVSDSDEFVVSQSDIARSVTRAQILSGVQPALALPTNTLLGRLSEGVGGPETINIGANLILAGGAISGSAPFNIAGLTAGGAPSASDLVPLAQGGQNAALNYASFIGGIAGLTGISGSNLTAQATSGLATRTLAEILSDGLSVEDFGAAGDGVTDDTQAFVAALASGRPLRLGGRIYVVNGPLDISAAAVITGIFNSSVITRRSITSPAAWISITAPEVSISGVIFDGASLAGCDMPAVSVELTCLAAQFQDCAFKNASGLSSGSGLHCTLDGSASHSIVRSSFTGNGLHGLYASGSGSLTLSGSLLQANDGVGLRVEAGVAISARFNRCLSNSIGISIGDWTVGPGVSQAGSAIVSGNTCSYNGIWGLAVSGDACSLDKNVFDSNGTTTVGGGMLARVTSSRLSSNVIRSGCYGLDARGCVDCLIEGNHVSTANVGVALGGSQNLAVRDNTLLSNYWGVAVSAIEPTLSFTPTGPITISENWIGFTAAQGGGIIVSDAAQGLALTGNDINGTGSATVDQALWLHTDAAIVCRNRWNNQARFKIDAGQVAGLEAIVVPDVADNVLVTSAPAAIQSVLTAHQADTIGQIAFIKLTNAGTGYTQAQVVIGGGGLGASASAIINDGRLIWIIVTNPGSGYGVIGGAAFVTVTGDGSGATATAYVGLPVIEGRQLRISCNTRICLALSGSAPLQQSWTGYASTVPAYGSVDLEGTFGEWRAISFPAVDYLTPTGDGGAIVQSIGGGNLTLRTATGGALFLSNSSEPVGCTSTVGRGSPVGVVSAPPGSDFRNLNGGSGSTFWVKQQNNDATGWTAVS